MLNIFGPFLLFQVTLFLYILQGNFYNCFVINMFYLFGLFMNWLLQHSILGLFLTFFLGFVTILRRLFPWCLCDFFVLFFLLVLCEFLASLSSMFLMTVLLMFYVTFWHILSGLLRRSLFILGTAVEYKQYSFCSRFPVSWIIICQVQITSRININIQIV